MSRQTDYWGMILGATLVLALSGCAKASDPAYAQALNQLANEPVVPLDPDVQARKEAYARAQEAAARATQAADQADLNLACGPTFGGPPTALKGKVPIYGLDESFEMKANGDKPTPAERKALISYGKEGQKCMNYLADKNPRNMAPIYVAMVRQSIAANETILARLAAGRISYAEYFEQCDAFEAQQQANLRQQQANLFSEIQQQNAQAQAAYQQQQNARIIANAIEDARPRTCYGSSCY